MIQRLFVAGTLAGVLLLSPLAQRPAEALVGAPAGLKATGDTPNIVLQVRRGFGGHSFGGRGFSGRSFGGRGFGARSFGSFRGYRGGPRIAGFRSGPRFYGSRSRGVYSGIRVGRHWGHRHRHVRWGRYRRYGFYGVPFVYSGYGYGYGYGYGGCGWLKRRAILSGSSYWWSRYQDCRYGYGSY